ncbi:putative Spore coat protein [[Clostridium] ultunense Esp]|uniref:TasA family protein n=1 Tax=Thermicanus aegyptius TaxID=94009 RepID=UPI0002B70B13|nr:TasA family protein [Thermicanus aegyptius]CCQ96160.1 putative Spore coat protein [[Clostridium] ultunense Esp]
MLKKKLGYALATTALGAMIVAGGTFALFTSEASNEGNTFTAGTVVIQDHTDGAIFDVTQFYDNLAPGDHESATITVSNSGTLDAWVKLDNADVSGALFEGNHPLVLTLDNSVKRIPAGGSATFTVGYSFPLEAGNEYQGATGEATIHVKAVQARNNTNEGNTGPISWGN